MEKKALITGGEALGGALALRLARAGYDIALAHGPGDISATVREIAATGAKCVPLPLDMADYAQACALPGRAVAALNGLSLCVNAAAIPMEGVLDERAYRVNLRSPYGITAYAAKAMEERDVQGAIVNVVPEDSMSMGLERVTRSAALEFSEFGIRVNNVRPQGNIEDIARCVLYFASIESDLVTGQMLADGVCTRVAHVPSPAFVKKPRPTEGRPRALITGASHGIGAGIARKFADMGYDIAFTYAKREEGAKETLQYLRQKGVRGFYYQASFEQEGVAEEVGQRALRDLGRIDLLVNNAGFTIFQNKMRDVELERLDRLYYTDYRAPMLLSRIAADDMRARGQDGCIVNISSVHASAHYIYDCWYGAVKYALNHSTRLWAAQLASDGIRVNAIEPGGTRGGLTFEELAAMNNCPLGRSGRPLDIAKCVAFFAGSESVSGQSIVIDAGFSLAGVPETNDPKISGCGWSTLRRRWTQEVINAFKSEVEWL